ncbi:MAG: NUDIX domain-containing protein, partial [Desulfobulbaceae bacterium]|nr:NUDIX domain-containing protein [Desulfobulbaceae bacterium]
MKRKSVFQAMRIEPQKATAAVAIIKCLAPKESFLILRRATHPLDPWSGHFSFPGGRKEKKDNSLLETCIRETVEEVGILLSPGTMQKQLPVTPAGRNVQNPIWVQPFIFVLHDKPSI